MTFYSEIGHRRGSWEKCSTDEWYCPTCSRLEIELEGVELARDDGTKVSHTWFRRKLRCTRYGENWLELSRSQRWVDKRKLLESELTDCSREEWSVAYIRRWMVSSCRRMAASGRWLRVAPMASMVPAVSCTLVALIGVEEGTGVEAILVLRSWVAAMIRVPNRMGVQELATQREAAMYTSLRWDEQMKLMENELRDCYITIGTAVFARRLTVVLGVVWRRTVSNGVDWAAPVPSMAPMASMVAHEGTDVEVHMCPSLDECTHMNRQQTTICFHCLVMIVNIVTVLSHGSAVVFS